MEQRLENKNNFNDMDINLEDKINRFIEDFYPTRQNEVQELITKINNRLIPLNNALRKGEQYLDVLPNFRRPCVGSDFGYFNEDYLTNYFIFLDEFDIKSFVNGKMNFPDIVINDVIFDFKAVKCPIGKNGKILSPNYHNAIHSDVNLKKEFAEWFDDGKASDLLRSFAIYTYYIDESEEHQRIIGFNIVPMICCIKTSDGIFSIKHKNEDNVLSANVCIGYNGINKSETYDECIERLKRVTFTC